jgi:transcription elongation factor GreA
VLRRWDEGVQGEFIGELKTLLDGGGDFGFTTLRAEQLDILEAATEAGLGGSAAVAAIPSRQRDVRNRAVIILRQELGDDLPRALREIYGRSPRDANRVLGIIEFTLDDPEAIPEAQIITHMVRATVAVVHGASREPSRRQALALLKPTGNLAKLVQELSLDEEGREALVHQLTDWRTTDRHLFPVLEFLQASGEGGIVEAVQRYRSERSAELVSRAKAGEDSGILMTRGSIAQLRDEINDIELALRTTIPESIRKAREHGDLSENAEYHAAKDKQRHFNQRLAQLQELLTSARAIEDAPRQSGVAAPGTEVVVKDLTDETEYRYWILGEGDGGIGADVISYRAPLGAALVGRVAGDEVIVNLDDGREHRWQVLEVRTRLP